MAAPESQRQRPHAQRTSVGPNILSKMLQLEKQSKEHRFYTATAMSAPHHSVSREKVNSFESLANSSPQTLTPATPPSAATAQADPPSGLIRRSQTMPTLTPEAKIPQKEKEKPSLTIDPSKIVDNDKDARASICGSPGWSDQKAKERKKAKKLLEEERKKQEKEKKDADKKAKKEAEKQDAAAKKAGKREGRLNKKPPPAAMETQRMPSELRQQQSESRRNSIISLFSSGGSSNENSRRSSRDLKRLSVVSTGSWDERPSRSTPGTSTEVDDHSGWRPSANGAAPQLPALPRFGWHSRSGSSGGSKSNSWGSSDEAYNRSLVEYANQLNLNQGSSSPQQPTFNQTLALQPPRPLGRSQTDTALVTVGQDVPVIKEVPRAVAERKGSDGSYHKQQHGAQGAHRSTKAKGASKAEDRATVDNNVVDGNSPLTKLEKRAFVHPLQANPILMRSSMDGSSYVHKQRMYQQQRSMAGFQDEEAIRDATRSIDQDIELPREKEDIPVDGRQAEIVLHKAKEVHPLPQLPPAQDLVSSNESVNHHHTYLRKPQEGESVVLFHPDNMPESKKHSFLGFPRRPKQLKQPSQTTSKSTGSTDTVNTTSRPSPRLDTKLPDRSPVLVSEVEHPPTPPPKGERTTDRPSHVENSPRQPPAGRSTLSRAVVEKERSPTGKSSSGRSKIANAVVDKESPPRKTASPTRRKEASPGPTRTKTDQDGAMDEMQMKDGSLARRHSRTRTSSSQLLNEHVSISPTLSRSTTAPVLPSFNMELFDFADDESQAVAPRPLDKAQKAPNTESSTVQKRGSHSPTRHKDASTNPKVPEVIISTAQPDGVVRKTSLKRPRSNPQLQTTPNPPVPNLDFLPQLKHQPLVKPKPRSQLRNSVLHMAPSHHHHHQQFEPSTAPRPSSSQFPVPAAPTILPSLKNNSAPNLASSTTSLPPRSPLRPTSQGGGVGSSPPGENTLISQRASTAASSSKGAAPNTRLSMVIGGPRRPFSELDKPVAKTFTVCCGCRYWHDLPSHLYEALIRPTRLRRDSIGGAGGLSGGGLGGGGTGLAGHGVKGNEVVGGKRTSVEEATLDAVVRCPWCEHFMSRLCCASWTGIVYLHERHH